MPPPSESEQGQRLSPSRNCQLLRRSIQTPLPISSSVAAASVRSLRRHRLVGRALPSKIRGFESIRSKRHRKALKNWEISVLKRRMLISLWKVHLEKISWRLKAEIGIYNLQFLQFILFIFNFLILLHAQKIHCVPFCPLLVIFIF